MTFHLVNKMAQKKKIIMINIKLQLKNYPTLNNKLKSEKI